MTQNEIMDMIVTMAEQGKSKAQASGFSEKAIEVVDLFERWRMFTGGFSLSIPENVPSTVREAIDAIRREIIEKLGALTADDMSGNTPAATSPATEEEKGKSEELGSYVDFQGFTPKPEPREMEGDELNEISEKSEEQKTKREISPEESKPFTSPVSEPKISLSSTPSEPVEGKKPLPTIAELLKNNLDKALALKNAEFSRDKLLLSFLPVILDSIRAGLGIELIYQHVASSGFAGSVNELVQWLNSKAPAEMTKYMCTTEDCHGVIMKMPEASDYILEMRWRCPSCGKVYENMD